MTMASCKKCNKEKGTLAKSKSDDEHKYNGWCQDCMKKDIRAYTSANNSKFISFIKGLFS